LYVPGVGNVTLPGCLDQDQIIDAIRLCQIPGFYCLDFKVQLCRSGNYW
jgi:hypothetical protein